MLANKNLVRELLGRSWQPEAREPGFSCRLTTVHAARTRFIRIERREAEI
jgi:hypothetical protein